ncbi:tax1-binding protein 1 homolog [Lingula anatina]|uniref:Tax1-binding protein 1 homolog n=1 Tax=Lingula anatina TaxID=7574 RepID=A0A1S3IFN7_LINAN|nr:tax1-binding protein 1 homolog [Lingula anatina]|eukprot:XP_013396953.1 tax1-binding protein 1 homolog [Lingula anatina]
MIKKEKEKADTKAQDQDEQILALKARLQSEEVQMQNDAAGAAFALQPVLNDLKDRYKRYKNKYDLARIEKENLTRRQEQWKQQEQDLRREVDDLKARLKMGADEYKALHIQYQKATKKLAAKEPKVEKKAPLVEEVLTEVAQQLKATELDAASPSAAAAETRADQGGDFEVVTSIPTSSLSIEELQAQFDDLGQELEKRTMKKKMYKQKFLDEREKNDFLRKHYEEELQKKTALISDLNGKIEALEKDSAGNEKMLAEVCNKQKLEITRLSGMLAAERGNKTASYALPPDGLPSPATPPVIMEYGNPYAPVLPPALSPEIRHPAMGNPLLAAESTLLDPPMKPEILPSAKVAAVMAVHKKESSSENSSSSSTTEGDDFPTEQDLVAPPAEEPSKKDQTAEEADTPDGEEEK